VLFFFFETNHFVSCFFSVHFHSHR
jgi:hypothetical protein